MKRSNSGSIQFYSTLLVLVQMFFKSLLRDRVFFNLVFVGLFFGLFGFLCSQLVFGHQDRVMIHIGLFVSFLMTMLIAIYSAHRVLFELIVEKTSYLILTKPISRGEVWGGIFLSLILFLGLNLFALGSLLALVVWLIGGEFNFVWFRAYLLIWVESGWVIAFTMMLSLFFRPALVFMLSGTALLLSHSAAVLENMGFISLMGKLLPDATHFLSGTRVYYDQAWPLVEWITHFGYGLGWALLFILIGYISFLRKNL